MNLQGKRAAIVTLGCKVNQYETDAMYGMLKQAGVIMVDPKEAADIYIVNTCSDTYIINFLLFLLIALNNFLFLLLFQNFY